MAKVSCGFLWQKELKAKVEWFPSLHGHYKQQILSKIRSLRNTKRIQYNIVEHSWKISCGRSCKCLDDSFVS